MIDTFNCGHPRTPKNTQSIGKAGLVCRKCRLEYHKEWRRKNRPEESDNPMSRYFWSKRRNALIIEMREGGATFAAIAEEIGVQRTAVSSRIRKLVKSGDASPELAVSNKTPWTTEQKITLVDARRRGLSFADAGKIIGKSSTACAKQWTDLVAASQFGADAVVKRRQVPRGPVAVKNDRRTLAVHEEAARYVAAHDRCPVFRVNGEGKPDPNGEDYCYGSSRRTQTEIISMAKRKGWNPDAWKDLAA